MCHHGPPGVTWIAGMIPGSRQSWTVDMVPPRRVARARPLTSRMAFGALQPQAQGLPFGMAPGAFEAQADAGVELVGSIDPIMIDDAGVRQGTALGPPVPIGLGARDAGGLQGEPGADRREADGGHEPVDVASALGGGAALAAVLLQEHHVAVIPAQFHGSVRQGILPLGTVAMGVDLAWGRLAELDRGVAVPMVGTEL